MKTLMRGAHIVVVAGSDHGLMLAARLRRMARVTAVSGHEEARDLCRRGHVDACIVVDDDPVPDAPPSPIYNAPGRGSGVPSLMIVHTVTPHARKTARRAGYLAAVPASIAPRMLYRRVGAALQRRRAVSRKRRPVPDSAGLPFLVPSFAAVLASNSVCGKPTLH